MQVDNKMNDIKWIDNPLWNREGNGARMMSGLCDEYSPRDCHVKNRRRDVIYGSSRYSTWHTTLWDGPALMLVVVPSDSGAPGLIGSIERYLLEEAEVFQSNIPKLICRDATNLTPQAIAAICANYGNPHDMERTNGWNVVLQYERPEDVPAYFVKAARYIVLHESFFPAANDEHSDLTSNFPPKATPTKSSTKWKLDVDTGIWRKYIEDLDTHATHAVSFGVVDRRTRAIYLDVTSRLQ